MTINRTLCLLVALWLSAPVRSAELGTVELATSCNAEANAHVQRGVALLHHMTYARARDSFAAAAGLEPTCAIAHWGIAMTFVHPLWSDPPRDRASTGAPRWPRPRSPKARRPIANACSWSRGRPSSRTAIPTTRRRIRAPGSRRREGVRASFRRDPEVGAVLRARAPGDCRAVERGIRVAAARRRIARTVSARFPDHPGAHHYLVHAYDCPPLAERALDVVRAYERLAPEVPHALHMPTHIFTRLGEWDAGRRELALGGGSPRPIPAPRRFASTTCTRSTTSPTGTCSVAKDDKAAQVRATLQGLQLPVQTEMASAYALAAIPARIAIERQNWAAAMALEPGIAEVISVAVVSCCRGDYALRSRARRRSQSLAARWHASRWSDWRSCAIAPNVSNAYWGTQVEIQRLAASAWLTLAEGQRSAAAGNDAPGR